MAGALSPQFKGIHLHFRKCSGNSVFHQFVLAGPGGQHIHNWTTKPATHQLLLVLRSSLRYACFLLSSHHNSGLRTSTISELAGSKTISATGGEASELAMRSHLPTTSSDVRVPLAWEPFGRSPITCVHWRGTEDLPMNLASSSQAIL